ncbi:MAG: hypothetical protein JOZ19_10650 [Rubrobacter sp.]|nr:hypothetical protein [Rubrobacter sp.]
MLEPLFFWPSTYADVIEEFAELLAISSRGFTLYLIYRAEREEIASLRRSANVDDLTNLSNRSFFRRAATRWIELSERNDLPARCSTLMTLSPITTAMAMRPEITSCAV